MAKEIPYKIYLEESEMPKAWYNVRADMKKKPAPLLNPQTHKPGFLNLTIYCSYTDKDGKKQNPDNEGLCFLHR